MHLAEAHHTSKKGKSESAHSNRMPNYSSDLSSFMPEHELVELLWENGQIVMQGQSNRTKKSSFGTSEFAFNGRLEEKGCEDDAAFLKFEQNGEMDSAVHDMHPTVPCAMNVQEDDSTPWLNYSIDDSLQNDFCSEFFSELTGGHAASLSNSNSNLYPANKSSGYVQTAKDSHIFRSSPGGSEPSKTRFNHLFNVPQQWNKAAVDVDINITRLQKQDTGAPKSLQQGGGACLMNFSHFSRPAALAKANLHSIDRLKSHERSCSSGSAYPVDSTVIESSNGGKNHNRIQMSMEAQTHPKLDSGSYGKTSVNEASQVHNSSTVINRNSSSSDAMNCQASSLTESMAAERTEAERVPETIVASSSVCSGYGAGAASTDPKHRSKRSAREGEESGEQSDELEDESFAVKKPSSTRVTNGKRSRAAEVHNLSERRRRDRINEKMKALQDLIPNCNKVDKASMLDEAIEYLKTLQLQVQMMSMGSGLCMPPMILPAGMNFQHLRAPPISHFSPLGMGMGVGMGMGMGFGMGMIDLNGSPGLIPVPPLHGTQFPCPPVPVPGFHRMPHSSSIHSLGIPGQKLPLSVPHASLFTSQTGLPPQGTLMNPLQVSDTPPSSSSLEAAESSGAMETKGQASQAGCLLMQKEGKELHGVIRNATVNPNVNNGNTAETSNA